MFAWYDEKDAKPSSHPATRVHAHRTAGGHHHHRHFGGDAAAGAGRRQTQGPAKSYCLNSVKQLGLGTQIYLGDCHSRLFNCPVKSMRTGVRWNITKIYRVGRRGIGEHRQPIQQVCCCIDHHGINTRRTGQPHLNGAIGRLIENAGWIKTQRTARDRQTHRGAGNAPQSDC